MRFYRNDNSRSLWQLPWLGHSFASTTLVSFSLSAGRSIHLMWIRSITPPHSPICMDLLMGLLSLDILIFFVDFRSAQLFYFFYIFIFFLYFYFFIFFLLFIFFCTICFGNFQLLLVVNVLSLFVFVCLCPGVPPCFLFECSPPGQISSGGGVL